MSWGGYVPRVIDHTKCGSSDSSDYVFEVFDTHTEAKSVANGGKMQTVYDYAPFSDAALTTMLPHQRVFHDQSTGRIGYRVNLATLSHTVDTTIYFGVGNASITTDQQNASNAWGSNVLVADPLGDGTTLSGADAKGGTSLTTQSGSPAAAAGPMGGGVSLVNASYGRTSAPANNGVGTQAWEVLFKPSTLAASDYQTFLDFGGSGGNWILGMANGKLYCGWGGGGAAVLNSGTVLVPGTQYHLVIVWDCGAGIGYSFNNGAQDNSAAMSGGAGLTFSASQMILDGTSGRLQGTTGEVVIHSSKRTADYWLTRANNLLSPSTFYSVGSYVSGSITLTATTSNSAWAAPTASVVRGALSLSATTSSTTWASPTAAIVPAALTLAATTSPSTWAAAAASVVVDGIALTGTTSSSAWAAPNAAIALQLTLTATTSSSAWANPVASLAISAIALTATTAGSAWGAPVATITLGAVTCAATTGAATWGGVSASTTVSGVTLSASTATSTWSAIDGSLQAGGTLNATTSPSPWSSPNASIVLGAVMLQAVTGPSLFASPVGVVLVGGDQTLAAITGNSNWAAIIASLGGVQVFTDPTRGRLLHAGAVGTLLHAGTAGKLTHSGATGKVPR